MWLTENWPQLTPDGPSLAEVPIPDGRALREQFAADSLFSPLRWTS
jgi:hypothetical protein